MHKKTYMQIARRLFLLAAATGALLVSGAAQVMAAPGGGGGTPLTCSIAPQNGTARRRRPVHFYLQHAGGKGGKSYAWTFSGPASPTSSTNQTRT